MLRPRPSLYRRRPVGAAHWPLRPLGGLLAGLLLGPTLAGASFCTVDETPAATILVPYFEVDLDAADGANTIVHLHNRSAEATLARVTLWSDRSIPTVGFDVFLTGHDVVRLDLRDLFAGNVPATADALADPGDSVSPHGANPEWDASFPGCDESFPITNPLFTGPDLDRLVNGHTGQPVQVGEEQLCLGTDHGDTLARGYLTLDDAVRCAGLSPTDPGYFGGAHPVASNDNQLWAEVWWTDPSESRRAVLPAVHLEADPTTEPALFGFDTFYGRYGTAGQDRRERLPSVWAASTLDNAAVSDDWIAWRDSDQGAVAGYACGEADPWAALGGAEVVCFDEEENPISLCGGGVCLGLGTQRLAASDFVVAESGWCRFDVVTSQLDYHQAWLGVVRQSPSKLGDSGAFAASVLGSACPDRPLFADSFEAGDTTRWSATVEGGSP